MTKFEAREAARSELLSATSRLIAAFAGSLSAATVVRHIARAREELLRAGVRAGLAVAAESAAEARLLTLLPAHTLRRVGSAGSSDSHPPVETTGIADDLDA
jgi:hypothetical protein